MRSGLSSLGTSRIANNLHAVRLMVERAINGFARLFEMLRQERSALGAFLTVGNERRATFQT